MPKYEKFENILKIINILDKSRYPVSIDDLAEELCVNKKSIYRYLNTINLAGIPITSFTDGSGRPTGRYMFFSDFNMKKLNISSGELTLLVILHEFTKKMKNKFTDSFQSILNKVVSESERDLYYIKIPDGMVINGGNEYIKNIERAIIEEKKIRLKYIKNNSSESTVYKISPLKILFFDGFWYLLGITEKKKYLIKYRLDNIRSLYVLDEKIDSSRNIKSMLDNSINIFFPKERNITVKIKVDKEASSYFKKKTIFPEQKITEENENGLLIETKAAQFIEIIRIICQWIPHVIVIEPEEMKWEIISKIEDYLKKIK